MEQESTRNPQSPPVLLGSKFRRRPPHSEAETKRRQAWGKEWGQVGAEYAKQLRAKEKR